MGSASEGPPDLRRGRPRRSTRSTRSGPWTSASLLPSCAPSAPTAGRRLPVADAPRRCPPPATPPRTRVPAAAAGRDDPGGRGRLVRGGRLPWTVRSSIGEQVDDRDVLWNLGNAALQLGDDDAQQHFYGYALVASAGGRRGDGGRSTACRGSASATTWPATSSPCAAAPRRPSSLGQSIGQPAMTALPDRLAGPARGPAGPRRLRRPPAHGSRSSSRRTRWGS